MSDNGMYIMNNLMYHSFI